MKPSPATGPARPPKSAELVATVTVVANWERVSTVSGVIMDSTLICTALAFTACTGAQTRASQHAPHTSALAFPPLNHRLTASHLAASSNGGSAEHGAGPRLRHEGRGHSAEGEEDEGGLHGSCTAAQPPGARSGRKVSAGRQAGWIGGAQQANGGQLQDRSFRSCGSQARQ